MARLAALVALTLLVLWVHALDVRSSLDFIYFQFQECFL